MQTEKLKKLIDSGKYPIIHPEDDIEKCIMCCPTDKGYLAECRHYVVLTDYDKDGFYCRIVTSSSKYGNIKVTSDDYKLSLFSFIIINYYSKKSYWTPFACLDSNSYKGYFTKMYV